MATAASLVSIDGDVHLLELEYMHTDLIYVCKATAVQ